MAALSSNIQRLQNNPVAYAAFLREHPSLKPYGRLKKPTQDIGAGKSMLSTLPPTDNPIALDHTMAAATSAEPANAATGDAHEASARVLEDNLVSLLSLGDLNTLKTKYDVAPTDNIAPSPYKNAYAQPQPNGQVLAAQFANLGIDPYLENGKKMNPSVDAVMATEKLREPEQAVAAAQSRDVPAQTDAPHQAEANKAPQHKSMIKRAIEIGALLPPMSPAPSRTIMS